jgi:hypothetical protein
MLFNHNVLSDEKLPYDLTLSIQKNYNSDKL